MNESLDYQLNIIQLEISVQQLKTIMIKKPAFKERWLKLFKYAKNIEKKSPKEAMSFANRMLGAA